MSEESRPNELKKWRHPEWWDVHPEVLVRHRPRKFKDLFSAKPYEWIIITKSAKPFHYMAVIDGEYCHEVDFYYAWDESPKFAESRGRAATEGEACTAGNEMIARIRADVAERNTPKSLTNGWKVC